MLEQRRRGPQRSEASHQAILSAAARQFTEHGYDHLTMEGIAAEAHVGKQTIYRWWPSKGALVSECLAQGMLIPDWFVPDDSGDPRADLTAWLRNIAEFLRSPGNESMLRSLVVAAAEHEDVAIRLNEHLGVWRMLGDRVEADAIEIGEALIGAVVVRSLRRGPLDEDFVRRLVDAIVR